MSRGELEMFLDRKRDELEGNKIKGKSDGFGFKTLHDLNLFLKYYDEENESEISNNIEVSNDESKDKLDNDLIEGKSFDKDLFKTYVDYFFNNQNVTIRSKNLLNDFKINNLNDLRQILKNSHEIYSSKGYGPKSVSDLENLYNFLLKKYVESDIRILNDNPRNFNITENNILNEEKFIHEDLFKTYVDQFFRNEDVTIRSKNVIEDLNIKNLLDLNTILKNSQKIYSLRGYGVKTISDLEKLYLYILKKESESKIENVNNERVLFYNILSYSYVDDESLLLASKKEIDIFKFVSMYFDDIFFDLSKSSKLVLKYNIGFTLLEEEIKKIEGLTKERIRQLNHRLSESRFSIFKEKIIQILKLSNQEIIFNKSFVIFNNEILKFKSDENFNYKLYLFIYFVVNDNYDFINLNIFEKSYKLFEINNLLFYKKKSGYENIFKNLIDSIESILHKKIYSESIIIHDINSEEYLEDKEYVINYIINFNNCSDSLIYEQGVLKNNKYPNFETLIEMSIKYYNDLTTVEMIQAYLKEKYPGVKFNKEKIRITILRNKIKFFNLGKTGKYGLLNENYNQLKDHKIQGFKSIRILVSELLIEKNTPLHLNTIIKNLISKYNTLNTISLDRIIRDTVDFESIGQSFFILSNSNKKFEVPVNHKKIFSLIHKFGEKHSLNTSWVKKEIIIDYFILNNVPNYQIDYLLSSEIFVYENKATISFEKYISDDITEILEDINIEKVIKTIYENTSMTNKIQIRKNLKKYIQSEYHITILEEDIQKLINFHK